jgi:hypothetical protein
MIMITSDFGRRQELTVSIGPRNSEGRKKADLIVPRRGPDNSSGYRLRRLSAGS